MHLSVCWVLRLLFASFFFQVSSGSNYSPHLTILSSFHYLGCQTISKGTYRSTECQRILDLALMCPIRQLMSSMRAQLSLGKDKQSQSAESWSPDWPFPALFKTATVPSCGQRISKWQKLLFPHYFSHTTECILHKKSYVLLLHQTQTGWTVSHVQTELIHLFFPLISIFCWSGTSWREIDCQSNKQLCCLRSVSETAVNKPQHSSLRINALCLWKPWWSGHTDPPVEQPSVASVVQIFCSKALKLGMEPPIFQTVADRLHLKEPRSESSGG